MCKDNFIRKKKNLGPYYQKPCISSSWEGKRFFVNTCAFLINVKKMDKRTWDLRLNPITWFVIGITVGLGYQRHITT